MEVEVTLILFPAKNPPAMAYLCRYILLVK